jgi:ATP-dependent helicase HrpA
MTSLGWQLARLPIDPRVGRMLLAAHEHHCLEEMLIIASALETQDPRDRPLDKQQAADEAHAQFRDKRSDFISILNLWRYLDEQSKALSGNQFRKLCKQQFISWMRLREWRDTHRQLRQIVKEMKLRLNQNPADYESLHKALLHGLLGHIGQKDEDQAYRGARNSRFQIFPGSGLSKKQPPWLVAAEIVETSRIYARTVATVEPEWIEQAGKHLLHYEYLEPHWRRRRGYVAVQEKARLYGLVVSGERYVNLASKNPELAREIFIRRALVEQDYESRAPFWKHNRQLIEDIESLEHRQRRRDVLVGEEDFFRFYDQRLPAQVHSHRSFEKWRKRQEKDNPRLLYMNREDLMQHDAADVTAILYPEYLEVNGNRLTLDYHFSPGHDIDGISIRVPLYLLTSLKAGDFEWLVPGLLEEKVIALIRSLPKPLRRRFVPVPEYAHACVQALEHGDGDLLQQLSLHLNRMSGYPVSPDDLKPEQIPEHLQMRFIVTDNDGLELANGRDLAALQYQLGDELATTIDQLKDDVYEREGITEWDFGELPEQHVISKGKQKVTLYPALWDCGDSVSLTLCGTKEEAMSQSRWGVVRLCMLTLKTHYREMKKRFKVLSESCLAYSTLSENEIFFLSEDLISCDELIEQAIYKAFEHTVLSPGILPRRREEFDEICNKSRLQLQGNAEKLLYGLKRIFMSWAKIYSRVNQLSEGSRIRDDIGLQLNHLLYRGFVESTPYHVLLELPRYLDALDIRIERFRHSPERDERLLEELSPYWQRYLEKLRQWHENGLDVFELSGIHWMLEEFRVSLFAQELGTKQKVSEKRIRALFKENTIEL